MNELGGFIFMRELVRFETAWGNLSVIFATKTRIV